MKKILLTVSGIILVFVLGYISTKNVSQIHAAFQCINNNGDCQNASDHSCCNGLSCQHAQGNSYKCKPEPTATPTPTPRPTATPTPTPTPKQDKCDRKHRFDEDCITPTPTPIPTVTPEVTPVPEQVVCTENCGNPPTFAGSSTNPPTCSDGNTIQTVANPFVVRKGSDAIVNFFITQGDSANIYYRIVGQSSWQFSVPDVKPNGDNFVSYTIHGLNPALGYDFGIQQKFGCGGGQLVTVVIVDGPMSQTFGFSYWEWSK